MKANNNDDELRVENYGQHEKEELKDSSPGEETGCGMVRAVTTRCYESELRVVTKSNYVHARARG